MNIKNKFKDFKERLSDRHMYSIILVFTAVIAGFGIYQYKRSVNFRDQVETGYQRAFTELVDYVNNVDTTLSKAMVANSPARLSALATDLWRQAAFAQANLGQLPIANQELDNTANFLSQVGDYTYSLSRKFEQGETLSQKEIDQLSSLSKYSSQLNERLKNMEGEMFSGVLRFNEFQKIGKRMFGNNEQTFSSSMTEVENGFADYASLIYDGPFSQHMQNKEPLMIKDVPEISQDDAKTAIINFLGTDKVQSVEITGESSGKIPTYICNIATSENKREITAEVTKNGGYVLFVLDNRAPQNGELDINGAALKARDFLSSRGYESMHESYYQREGNTVIINYAYKQDDFVMYTDLIKVKIALDNGEMIGFESYGYLTNHIENRKLPQLLVTQEEARSKIRKEVEALTVNYALIPLESGQEVFCYEIKGTLNDKNYLVYVNVENGKEEKILLLLENDNGTLTI